MNFKNERRSRLTTILKVHDLFAEIKFSDCEHPDMDKVDLIVEKGRKPLSYSIKPEPNVQNCAGHVYNMPFLFNSDGTPWMEANSYLISLIRNKHFNNRPTDDVRRKASRLLHYKVFCEKYQIDWLDFSGKRPSNRPTYKYFKHLIDEGKKSFAVINQYTAVVYDFYKYVSKYWHNLDIDRVDSVSTITILVPTNNGAIPIRREKRSQTKPSQGKTSVPIGYVRDNGEDLRPLNEQQLQLLLDTIHNDNWSAQEQIIITLALLTGARKQSILTIREKHLDYFDKSNLNADNTYTLPAGPGTSIDTKFNKRQTLYVPLSLAESLIVYSHSSIFKARKAKFLSKFKRNFPELNEPAHQDVYLFLSDQGNCYYMGEDDPRYPFIKSRPSGQLTHSIKRKLARYMGNTLPKDFNFHWLRATYAHQLYLSLQPLVSKGILNLGDEISFIQSRLHHRNRETTENYLKLFSNMNLKMEAQELFEDLLFKGVNVDFNE